jgi:alkylhydroperoxidase family enzyme
LALGLIGAASGQTPTGQPGKTQPPSSASEEANRNELAAKFLESAYRDQRPPEAVRMLIAILRGSLMGPGDGWFGPAESRYSWSWLASRCGVDPSQRAITAEQFKGPPALFARLDRNKDGRITPDDLDWSDRNPYVQMSYMLNRIYRRLDSDGDAKLTKDELAKFIEKAGQGESALSPEQFRDALLGGMSGGGFIPGDAPTTEQLIRGLFAGEVGSINEGPKLDQPAPNFTLKTVDGSRSIQLSELVGKKPLVLVFGNFTCGPFRSFYPEVEAAYNRNKKDADFLMVYVREAHPNDGWKMESNTRVGVAVPQPNSLGERVEVAKQFCQRLNPTVPVVVDEINDPVGHAYSGMPARLYIIDRQGKVAYKSGRGPFGFRVGEMEQALCMLQLEEAGRTAGAPGEQPKGGAAPPASGAPKGNVGLNGWPAQLDDAAAWQCLPELTQGERGPLPTWAKILAPSLPRTTALMLELDYAQRAGNPLDPKLRGLVRYVAADLNRCEYTKAYALADLERVGLSASEVQRMLADPRELPGALRIAVEFARKMTTAAWSVEDAEFAELVRLHGVRNAVALVHVLAYANFQDRLVLGLGLALEHDGPLPPRDWKFARAGEVTVPSRQPPQGTPVQTISAGIADPEWLALDYSTLQKALEAQRGRQARVRVPTAEELMANPPKGMPTTRPPRVRWGMTGYYYAPELTAAWLDAMRMFGQESKQDRVFEELYFWIVTRSLQCFY